MNRSFSWGILLASSLLVFPAGSTAQTAATGPEGSTSIGVKETDFGAVQLTTADKAAKLNIGRAFRDIAADLTHWYDFTAGARVKDDVGSLFRKGSLSPDARVSFVYGRNLAANPAPEIEEARIVGCQTQQGNAQECISRYVAELGGIAAEACSAAADKTACYTEYADAHPVGSSAWGLWLTLGVDAVAGEYRLHTPSAAFDSQIDTDVFFGPAFRVGMNFWAANIFGSSVVGGLRAGVARENNAGDLTVRNLEEVSTYTSPDGTVQRRVITTSSVYQGAYEEYTGFPIDADFIVKPLAFRNIAFNALARADFGQGRATTFRPGVGLLFLKGNNALTPLGGISATVDDVLSDDIQDDSFWEHLKVNLVLNVTIPRLR
jgi:hypothetical protein